MPAPNHTLYAIERENAGEGPAQHPSNEADQSPDHSREKNFDDSSHFSRPPHAPAMDDKTGGVDSIQALLHEPGAYAFPKTFST